MKKQKTITAEIPDKKEDTHPVNIRFNRALYNELKKKLDGDNKSIKGFFETCAKMYIDNRLILK